MPALGSLLQLRSDKKGWDFTCDTFLQCVVGKAWYEKKKTTEPVSSFASVSDVAFILLTLENNWTFWSSIKANQSSELDETNGDDNDQETPTLPTATRWTSTNMHGGKNSGWSKEGLQRFNDLHALETNSRSVNQDVEKEYMEAKQRESSGARKKRKAALAPHGVVACIDESMFGNI
jgi:hypothetical protein